MPDLTRARPAWAHPARAGVALMTWREQALCRDQPVLWDQESERDTNLIEEAKRICHACPVREACLRAAMAGDEVGIWGGTITFERLMLAGRLPQSPSKWRAELVGDIATSIRLDLDAGLTPAEIVEARRVQSRSLARALQRAGHHDLASLFESGQRAVTAA